MGKKNNRRQRRNNLEKGKMRTESNWGRQKNGGRDSGISLEEFYSIPAKAREASKMFSGH
jgi:hypothetical protein